MATTVRSSRRSARRSGRSYRSHRGARNNKVEGDYGSQQDDARSSTTLPSIARSRIGERPVEFVPIKPVRPKKPRPARPAYNFRNRRTGGAYDARTGATTVPLGSGRRRKAAKQMSDGEERAWHQQLGDPSLPPPPNQRLLTTMEIHMVQELRHEAPHTGPAALAEEELELEQEQDAMMRANNNSIRNGSGTIGSYGSDTATTQATQGSSVKLPQIIGAQGSGEGNSDGGKPKEEDDAREVFDSFAQGKLFLHRAALSEVLVSAYRSAHNSSSRQAQAGVDRLLEQMTIDKTNLPPPPPPEDGLELEDKGETEAQEKDTETEWLKHVYNPEHITFEEFSAGWDIWQQECVQPYRV